ncbi:hypothetical protein GCM10023184_24230 [Flaviaesturariibacter amylovorans]|uniref:Uncharacterized protein n=1 Tax=Flaviaesturariibacter amylovorans TaxID=1084520 RepID=A0ABP8GZD7_9BACT
MLASLRWQGGNRGTRSNEYQNVKGKAAEIEEGVFYRKEKKELTDALPIARVWRSTFVPT